IDRPCVNVTIRNNTVVQSDTKAHPIVQIRYLGMEGFPVMSNNHYFRTNGAAQFWDERTIFKGTLAQWQTYTGTDTTSTESDPGLFNAAAPNSLSASASSNSVSLTWTDRNDFTQSGAGLHTYRIYRGET